MLLDFQNKPIIEYSLNLCKTYNLEPFIITRPEKQDLINYLNTHQIKYMLYNPDGKEWNETVLACKDQWDENNLLILPDTRFKSPEVIKDMQRSLEMGNEAVIALHEVPDPSKWGIITPEYELLEKPAHLTGNQKAWGLISFKNTYGQELFSNVKYIKLKNTGFVFLEEFKDITR